VSDSRRRPFQAGETRGTIFATFPAGKTSRVSFGFGVSVSFGFSVSVSVPQILNNSLSPFFFSK
jgi:hypothetical protein